MTEFIHKYHPDFLKHIAALIATVLSFALSPDAHSLNPDFYAASSRLSTGKWVRIEVTETGMQFISNATLKSLGFHNTANVTVYGYGGRILPEKLSSQMKDDLPPVGTLHTTEGIMFFGHNTLSWTNSPSGSRIWVHETNPYSSKSYYFLNDSSPSDNPLPEKAEPVAEPDAAEECETTFVQRLLHEQDISAPFPSGRLMLGEDFRTQNSRTFNFNLPGNNGDATVCVSFGTYTTGKQSTLSFEANGTTLDYSPSDNISAVNNEELFITLGNTVKNVANPGEKLAFTIKHSTSGALTTASLNYIEVEYPRRLQIENEELYFYFPAFHASRARIEGADQNTIVWDVTDPLKPMPVETVNDGSGVKIQLASGAREIVAFNPLKPTRQIKAAETVANQDIHSLTAPDLLIISPREFMTAAKRLASFHEKNDSMKVSVLTPEEIYNEFSSGSCDVTAFRKLLKMWYDRSESKGTRPELHCLLFGRPTYDPKGITAANRKSAHLRIPIWQTPSGTSKLNSYSTDDYIGMLADNSSSLNMSKAQIHAAVGRMPVKSLSEALAAVEKIEKHCSGQLNGPWKNKILYVADDQDDNQHLNQAEKAITALRSSEEGRNLLVEKLYLDTFPLVMSGTGATYPGASSRLMSRFDEGVAFIDYIGHANEREWGHEQLLTWTQLTSLSNNRWPVLFAATCDFLKWDADEICGGEEMWLNPSGGVIAMICPSRKVIISQNNAINSSLSQILLTKEEGRYPTLGQALALAKNQDISSNNKLRFALMGDPAMKLMVPDRKLTVDSIMPVSVKAGETDGRPVLPARSKAKACGIVLDAYGNPDSSFNGELTLQLFDAEKAVETFGNGDDGKPTAFNDRSTRLFIGKAKVQDGKWNAEFHIPSEIENNLNTALISLYALSPDGREAHGHSEDLYIFGYNESAGEDNDGPEITSFYLDNPSWTDGAPASPAPTVYASFRDSSGINVSDAGIGHSITLTLDGKQTFDDVKNFYTPGIESIDEGSIRYSLNDITPGSHTLELTVWDNANNSSKSTVNFNIRADWKPSITSLSTDCSPARDNVTFILATDCGSNSVDAAVEVLDLLGKRLWTSGSQKSTSGRITFRWNLEDLAGRRVPRGLYLYRATITTSEGQEISKTSKLPVAAH